MDRVTLEKYIEETYSCAPEYPWIRYSDYAVYRHQSNQKWFAVVMNITKDKLGFDSNEPIDIVNLKCDQLLLGSLICQPGFFRAYHMSKTNWISVILDGSADEETVKWLLQMSYDATMKKK